MSLVENAVCDQQYHNATSHRLAGRKIIQDDMLCAGTEGRDSCQVSPSPSRPPPRAGGQPGLSAVSPSSGRLRRPSGLQDDGCLALGGSGQLGRQLCREKPSRGLRSRPDVRALDHAANREGPLTRACWPSARLGPEERRLPPPRACCFSLCAPVPGLGSAFASGLLSVRDFPDCWGKEQEDARGRAGSPWGPGCLAVLSVKLKSLRNDQSAVSLCGVGSPWERVGQPRGTGGLAGAGVLPGLARESEDLRVGSTLRPQPPALSCTRGHHVVPTLHPSLLPSPILPTIRPSHFSRKARSVLRINQLPCKSDLGMMPICPPL